MQAFFGLATSSSSFSPPLLSALYFSNEGMGHSYLCLLITRVDRHRMEQKRGMETEQKNFLPAARYDNRMGVADEAA